MYCSYVLVFAFVEMKCVYFISVLFGYKGNANIYSVKFLDCKLDQIYIGS